MNSRTANAIALATSLKEAEETARRSWLFSGPEAYGPLWKTLTLEGRQEEMKRNAQLLLAYQTAQNVLIKAAPSLINALSDETDNHPMNVRIMLEVTLEVAGVPYSQPSNHCRIMPAPGGFLGVYADDHPGWQRLEKAITEIDEANNGESL